jgi:hypothetical protein
MADKPVNSVTTTSMIMWFVVLLVVIFFMGISNNRVPFLQKRTGQLTPTPQIKVDFNQNGELDKTLNDALALSYQDKNKKVIKRILEFNTNSRCGSKDKLISCDLGLLKVGDKVTIEGIEDNKAVMVVKLTK